MIVRAALVQMSVEPDKERNVATAEGYVRQAAADGAQIVCLPELFTTSSPRGKDERHLERAEPIPGPTIERLQAVAAEHAIVVIAPIYERADDGARYNSAAVIGTDGGLLGVYRKSHIGRVAGVPITPEFPDLLDWEPYYCSPGDSGFQVFDSPFGRIGVLICYDRNFPEGARELALRGAEIVFVPACTAGTLSRDLWEVVPQAHAGMNVCYVGAVNRVGLSSSGFSFYGSSFFTDPRARLLAQAGADSDEIVIAELDLGALAPLREQQGFFDCRRPELYAELSDPEADLSLVQATTAGALPSPTAQLRSAQPPTSFQEGRPGQRVGSRGRFPAA